MASRLEVQVIVNMVGTNIFAERTQTSTPIDLLQTGISDSNFQQILSVTENPVYNFFYTDKQRLKLLACISEVYQDI